MKSKIAAALLAVILSLSIVWGCGKDKSPTSSNNNSNIPSELLGTWYYVSATINGVPASLALILGWEVGTVAARFTVAEDGSLTSEELDQNGDVVWTENGTISVSGNNATLVLTSDNDGPINPPDSIAGTWEIVSDSLILSTSYQGAAVVLKATKQ